MSPPRYQELKEDKEYNGSHSSGPSMRNYPLFIFLTALVFFFYVFYIYQAQSTELSLVREEYDSQLKQMRSIKEELIDAKAGLEKTKASEIQLKGERDDVVTKYEECQTSLRSVKLQSDSLGSEKSKLDQLAKENEGKVSELASRVVDLERNNSAMSTLAKSQDELVKQLNQTVQILQQELTSLKSSGAKTAQNAEPAKVEETKENANANANNNPNLNSVNLGDLIKKPAVGGENLTNNAGGALPVPEVKKAEESVKVEEGAEKKVDDENGEKAEVPEKKEEEGENKGNGEEAEKKSEDNAQQAPVPIAGEQQKANEEGGMPPKPDAEIAEEDREQLEKEQLDGREAREGDKPEKPEETGKKPMVAGGDYEEKAVEDLEEVPKAKENLFH